MTGFGLGAAAFGPGRVVAEVRSVNGRFLDVRVRLPQELAELSLMVESEARKRLSRGRCDIAVRTEGDVFSAPPIDKARARRAYTLLAELRDELAPGAEIPFSMLASMPDLFGPGQYADGEPAREAVRAALTSALDALEVMRQTEGRATADDLLRRIASVRELLDHVAERSPAMLEILARKFRERLARATALVSSSAGTGVELARELPIDPGRLEQELLLMVERSDISEELTRLRSHLAQLAGYIEAEEPLGRRLDFLLQEMAREINTIGAKSQDVRLSHAVVELKAEIERMREQVQNVE
jgi:uncharacterized protein (TIGR00255 family)